MNFNKYVNKVKYPYPQDVEKNLVDALDKNLPHNEYTRLMQEIPVKVKTIVEQNIEEYYKEAARLKTLFHQDVEQELGFSDLPQIVKDKIHEKAYEWGHSYGYSEIFNEYYDILDFVNSIREA